MFRKQFYVPMLIAASLAVSVAAHAQPGNGLKIEADGAPLKVSGPTAASPFVLALDAGHGGRDTGSRGSGSLLEKDVTLRVVKLLAERLGRRPEIKVVFTRESDAEISAVRRAAIANHNGSALMLSIQADASWRPGARNPSIIVAAPQRPPRVEGEGADALALRWQRGQNINLAGSRRFARGLQERFAKLRGGEKPPIRSLLPRSLEGARMPAVYISLGVISTPEEEARLREMDEKSPYIAAIEAEVVRYAGLPEKLPEPAEPAGAEAAEEKAEPEALGEGAAPRAPGGGN